MSPERSVTYVSERTLCLSNHLTKSPATTEVQLGPKFRHSTAARGTPQISAHLHYSVCVSHCGASVRLPQAVLSGCHGYSQLIHDGGVAMPESMEARALDAQFVQKRMQPSLSDGVDVPRRPLVCGKKQVQPIGLPGSKVIAQMTDQLR